MASHGSEEPTAEGELSLAALSAAFAEALGVATDGASTTPAAGSVNSPSTGSAEDRAADQATGSAPNEPGASPTASDDAHFAVTPRSILEGLLFVGDPGGGAISTDRLASVMRGVEAAELHALVQELNREYEQSGSALVIVGEGNGYRMSLRPEYAGLRERFRGRAREARLSQTAIDVLSLVAYRQPISAQEVADLRGTPSGPILAQLVRRELLRLERPDDAGQPPRYHTTRRFLDVLGIGSLDELPTSRQVDER